MRIIREIILFFIISFAFIYLVSIFTFTPLYKSLLYYPEPALGTSLLGSFGAKIASLSFFMIGKASFFLSLPLFLLIFSLLLNKKHLLAKIKWLVLFVIAISGFYGLYANQNEIIQGGLIGNFSGVILKNLFGIVGTTLILIVIHAFLISKLFPNLMDKINELKRKTKISQKIKLTHASQANIKDELLEQFRQDQEKKDRDLFTEGENKKDFSYKNQRALLSPIEYAVIDESQEKANLAEQNVIIENSEAIALKDHTKQSEQSEENTIQIQNPLQPISMEEIVKDQETIQSIVPIETELTEENHCPDVKNNVFINVLKDENYQFPSHDLLLNGITSSVEDKEQIREIGVKLISILKEFNIQADLCHITTGPVVTRYELIPPKGLKVNKIVNLADNIALGIAADDKIRIEAPIPGKSAIGIEVPNKNRQIVSFKELLTYADFKPKQLNIPFVLGKGISGKAYFSDITRIPHLLIAGSTNSGKSVCVNDLICTILYTKKPEEVRLLLVDPKRVELKMYDGIPHLLTPVLKEIPQAIAALNWAVRHMEERYRLLENYNVRNISGYNIMCKEDNKESLPYILVIIDEFADLIMLGGKDIEDPIIRLAAMARAVGIHLVLATQRPSADVITGLIKANFPGRISFKVSSKTESRIILDMNGAESLLGKGDMLYASPEMPNLIRIQSPFISDEEVYKITEFFKNNYKVEYLEEILETENTTRESEASDPSEEPLFDDARQIIMTERKASASYLQRRLKIGYNRAARIIEMMEEMGIIGPQVGSKPREILIETW